MKLKVYISDGTKCEEKDYAVQEFEGDKGIYALKQVLLAYMANQRQGNASTKTRAEVSGTGKKAYRQKGTGNARAGSRRVSQWRGGGIVFGPKPRDYSQKINRKVKRLAYSRALFDRAVAGDIDLIQQFEMDSPQTNIFNKIINRVVPKGKVLIIDDKWNDNVLLSARNIERFDLSEAANVSAYDLCRYDKIVCSESGMNKILSRISENNND